VAAQLATSEEGLSSISECGDKVRSSYRVFQIHVSRSGSLTNIAVVVEIIAIYNTHVTVSFCKYVTISFAISPCISVSM
jgi:hypothetical protein